MTEATPGEITDPETLTDDDWRQILSPQEFHVLRRGGTEAPGTGRYLDDDAEAGGVYACAGCGNVLYDAAHKFHSGCGWPSFYDEIRPEAFRFIEDRSHGMIRTEMRCARCDGHLGHVFPDGPPPTGKRHCVNGLAVVYVPQGDTPDAALKRHRAAL